MDPHTFRRNGPGLAGCESEAPWRRLSGAVGRIGPSTRADRSRTWPHLGRNLETGGKPIDHCARAGKSLATELGLRGAHEVGRGDGTTAVVLHPYSYLALGHRSGADHHRDVAFPHREVAGHQRIRHEGRAQSGLLCCEKCWPRWRSAWPLVYLLLLSGELAHICYFFTLAVAWTLADLAGRNSPGLEEVTAALSFRQAGGAR